MSNPKELEALSFRNLVEFHRDELTQIMNGTPATGLFTEYHSSGLIRNGVLQRGSKNKPTRPTPRAKEILVQSSTEEATEL